MLTFMSLIFVCDAQVRDRALKDVKPGSIYLSGYAAVNEAEKLESAEKYIDAWNKYHQALRYYKTIDINFPDWKKEMVAYRMEMTDESIKRLEPLAQKENLEKKEKYKKFSESHTSESGIPSPNAPATPKISGREQQRLTELAGKERQLKGLVLEERQKHQAEVNRLNKSIAELQGKLRKAELGVRADNKQTKIVNAQIRKLQDDLKSSKRQSRPAQQQAIAQLNELTRIRAQLATAPLKKDIENLAKDKARLEEELGGIVGVHKKLLKKHQATERERARLMGDLKLKESALNEASNKLANAKKSGYKVVKGLRAQIKAQAKQIEGLRDQVTVLTTENEGLRKELESANAINAELKQSLATVTLERDRLSEILDLSKSERTKRAIQEALRLGEALRVAKQSIKQLQSNQNAVQDDMLEAQSKLAVAKKKIIDLRAENTNYIRRIGSLEKNLSATKEKLQAQINKGVNNPLQSKEIETLKTALNRITNKLKRRKQAEKLLIAEYQKANINNPGLTSAIVNLTKSTITLTAKESEILKEQEDTGRFSIAGRSKSPEARAAARLKSQNQIDSLESLARRCVEKGSLETAKEIFDEAYDAHGHHYPFFINRGVVRVQLGEFMEAKDIFESGAQLKENNAYTHFMLGYCRFKTNDDVMAKKSLEAAIHIRPDYTEAYIYLALLEYENGNSKKAKEHLKKAVRIDPEHKEALFNLSHIHLVLKEKKQALDVYNNALKAGLAPNFEYEKKLGIKQAVE